MPAVSKKQQGFMGAELRRKREGKGTQTGMTESQLEDFASTKHKGLPDKKKEKKSMATKKADLLKMANLITNYNLLKYAGLPSGPGGPGGAGLGGGGPMGGAPIGGGAPSAPAAGPPAPGGGAPGVTAAGSPSPGGVSPGGSGGVLKGLIAKLTAGGSPQVPAQAQAPAVG